MRQSLMLLAAAAAALSGITHAAVWQTPATPPAAPPAASAAQSALPPGAGRDTMVRVCSGCHSPEVAATQRLDAQGWRDLVNVMASNGAQASDAEFDQITAYLAASFPAKPGAASTPAVAAPH